LKQKQVELQKQNHHSQHFRFLEFSPFCWTKVELTSLLRPAPAKLGASSAKKDFG